MIPRFMVAPVYLAQELGYFREAGLELEVQRIPESAQAIPLLAGGQLDVAFLGVAPALINAVRRGAHVRLVAAREVVTPNCGETGTIYGNRRAFPKGLGEIKLLKGRRVAVTGKTTHTAFILDVILESAGMSTDDVTVVYLRRNEALAALVGGKIDALAFGDLDALPASAPESLVRGPSVAELLGGLQTTFVFFGPNLLDGDPETGIGFLLGYLRGVAAFRAGRTPRVFETMSDQIGVDPLTAKTMCRDRLSRDGIVDRTSVERFVAWSQKKGFIEHPVEASQLIDTRFLNEALTRFGRIVGPGTGRHAG